MGEHWEYGVAWRLSPQEAHRAGMTIEEARTWIAETEDMGFKRGEFILVRRVIGEWRVPMWV